MILVDTSVWIDWFRKGTRPATILLDRLPVLQPSRQTYADAGALYARCRSV